MNEFLKAYIVAALWSSSLDDETPMDQDHGPDDLAPETLDRMTNDCKRFLEKNQAAIETVIDRDNPCPGGGKWIAYAGHDFWLTRNGAGVGFWDGDWPEPEATQLDEAAKAFGSCDLYVGDDDKIWLL